MIGFYKKKTLKIYVKNCYNPGGPFGCFVGCLEYLTDMIFMAHYLETPSEKLKNRSCDGCVSSAILEISKFCYWLLQWKKYYLDVQKRKINVSLFIIIIFILFSNLME